MKTIATFKVKIHKTSDKKKLKEGSVTYDYGAINIRSPELAKYVGKTVKVKIILEKPINEAV
ncbi:MAG: hypothetical protein ACREBJ_09295 [Nitrosotalea sp.]